MDEKVPGMGITAHPCKGDFLSCWCCAEVYDKVCVKYGHLHLQPIVQAAHGLQSHSRPVNPAALSVSKELRGNSVYRPFIR